jgi:hypothetical protein
MAFMLSPPQVTRQKHEQLMQVKDAMAASIAGGGSGGGAPANPPPPTQGASAPGGTGAAAGRRGEGGEAPGPEDDHMPEIGPAAPLHCDPSAAAPAANTSGGAPGQASGEPGPSGGGGDGGRRRSNSGQTAGDGAADCQLVPFQPPDARSLAVASLVTGLGTRRAAPAAAVAAEAAAALEGGGGGAALEGGEALAGMELQPLNFPLPSQVRRPGAIAPSRRPCLLHHRAAALSLPCIASRPAYCLPAPLACIPRRKLGRQAKLTSPQHQHSILRRLSAPALVRSQPLGR